MSTNIYIPYTYLIGWSSINKWYYGVRFCKNCHPSDLWVKYFTSSKLVKKLRESIGEPDVVQVRKTFNNSNSARIWENKVLKKLNVIHEDKWLNQTDNISIQPMIGEINSSKRPEVRAKLKIANSGNKHWNYGKSVPIKTIKKRLEKTQKIWYVINPEGVKFKIQGLASFCKENFLCYQSMKMIAKGKQKKKHNGWWCERI